MVCQRVAQILCGYEDANDCNHLRGDSALKMAVGRKPSDSPLSSQPTMIRLENGVGMKTLYRIGKLFVDEYIRSFDKAPKKVILDADDTNADTYGAQQLTLFNLHYNSHCYMPLLIFDGVTGKLLLPMLRPGRRNKSLNVARIMQRIVEYLHSHWPNIVLQRTGTLMPINYLLSSKIIGNMVLSPQVMTKVRTQKFLLGLLSIIKILHEIMLWDMTWSMNYSG